ncbi:MAG TPA: glycosyltransferase family 4 protein [Terriglobia bacterium]|nr:glycosyltransferase family 4 protein [Terriglobia bacterium]
MRILYVCQYFPPEVCAPAVRAIELSREWLRAGHEVTVLTGFPNHPEGLIHAEYLPAWRKGFIRDDRDGVRVYRTWLYPAANQGVWLRSANYLSFALSAALVGPWISPVPEIVMATSPQLLVGAAGYAIARWLGVPFLFEVRDLWPESLEAVGAASRQSLLYKSLQRLARFLYHNADRTILDGEWKQRALLSAGVPESKLAVIRNGVAVDSFPEPESAAARRLRESFRSKLNLARKFVVAYCGTFGMAQGLEIVLEAAERLRSRRDIVFLIAGEGSERGMIARRIAERNLTNILDLGKQLRENVPGLLSLADACVIPLRPNPVFETAIPSKVFEAMAAARPVILAVDGETKELVIDARAGIAVPPGDSCRMAEAVLLLQENPNLARRLGANGRRAAKLKYTRRQQAAAYLDVFTEFERRTTMGEEPTAAPQPSGKGRAVAQACRN